MDKNGQDCRLFLKFSPQQSSHSSVLQAKQSGPNCRGVLEKLAGPPRYTVDSILFGKKYFFIWSNYSNVKIYLYSQHVQCLPYCLGYPMVRCPIPHNIAKTYRVCRSFVGLLFVALSWQKSPANPRVSTPAIKRYSPP